MDSDKTLTAETLAQADKDLYEFIVKERVAPDTKQMVRWFISSDDYKISYIIIKVLNKILSGVRFFSVYSIKAGPRSGNKYSIIIETPDFLFTIQNVIMFSRSLLELANKNGCEYDFWEIEIDCLGSNDK